MRLLSKDEILATDDLPHADVRTPEWGKDTGIRVRVMSGSDREHFMEKNRASKTAETNGGFQALLISFCAVDERGALLFPTPEDVEALGRKNARALARVFMAASTLNRLGETDEAIEDFSEAAPTASTTSS